MPSHSTRNFATQRGSRNLGEGGIGEALMGIILHVRTDRDRERDSTGQNGKQCGAREKEGQD